MVDKIVDRIIKVPKVYEVERRVDVPIDRPYVYHVDRLVPQIITLNKSLENIVDRFVEIPTLLEKINRVEVSSEKIVPVERTSTNVETVTRDIEK